MNDGHAMNGDDGMGDLRDERLRHALAHAPDHTAAPNWRLRKAILDHAHEAVAPSLAPVPAASERSWWQRLLGLGGSGSGARMPWNAAFATVLVAALVTVLWQREPVPGARPDDEAPAAPAAQQPAEAPAAAVAPPAPPAPAPAPAPAPQAAESALPSSQDIPGTPLPPPVETAPPAPAKSARPAHAPERPAAAPTEPARRQAEEAALSAKAAADAKEARKREAPAVQPAPPAVPAPAPAPATRLPEAAGAAAPRDTSPEGLRREAERSAASQRFAAPASPAPGAARDANEARAPAAAAPKPRAAEPTELPSFAALSQWNRMTITRGGSSRSLSRAEAMELNALLGSAAISAVGAQPLAGAAEWRVTLERSNGEVLATLELGRNQVRWREGQKPATTGAPSSASLAALREALQHAVEPPAQPPPSQWQPAQPQQPPAEGGMAPTAPSR